MKHSGKPAVVEQALYNNESRPPMLSLIALSAALLQQPPVPPAPSEGQGRVVFVGTDVPGGLDKDGDGQITREEFAAPMNDHFARMDANSDGRLSTEELTSGHGVMGSGGEGPGVRVVRVPHGHGPHGVAGMPRVEIRRVDGREEGVHIERLDGHTRVVVGAPGADGRREIVVHGGPEGPDGTPGAEVRRETWGEWVARRGHQPGRGPDSGSLPPRIEFRRAEGPGGDHQVMVFSSPEGGAQPGGALDEGGSVQRIEVVRVGGTGGENDLDADNDGKISEAEFSAPLREAFARMDADRSGFIEAGERGSGNSEVFVHRIETGPGGED